MEAYENLSLDYFYLGLIDKATFYNNKFKYGDFEGDDSIVRRAAVECTGYMPARSACKLWVSRLLNDFANGFPQVEPGRMHSAPESITHALRESCMGDGLCPIAHA